MEETKKVRIITSVSKNPGSLGWRMWSVYYLKGYWQSYQTLKIVESTGAYYFEQRSKKRFVKTGFGTFHVKHWWEALWYKLQKRKVVYR